MLSSAAAEVWAASSLPAPRVLLPEDLSDRRLNCRCWCWDSRRPTSAFLRTFFLHLGSKQGNVYNLAQEAQQSSAVVLLKGEQHAEGKKKKKTLDPHV